MSNLQTATSTQLTTNTDFAVINGTGWVSQTKLAEMCGAAQQTINSAISRKSSYAVGWNLNENNQLDAKSAYSAVVHFATQGKPEAIQTLALIGEAGMQAYIFHQAGYTITVEPPKPMSKKELSMDAKYDAQIAKYRAMQEAANLRIEALRTKHKQTMAVLEAKTTKLLSQGAKVKGDLSVGKVIMPRSTITTLLRSNHCIAQPSDANYALVLLGYLDSSRKLVTSTGSLYGLSNKAGNGNASQALWFDSEFPELYEQIEHKLIEVGILDTNGKYFPKDTE